MSFSRLAVAPYAMYQNAHILHAYPLHPCRLKWSDWEYLDVVPEDALARYRALITAHFSSHSTLSPTICIS